jgi:predicted transcriptional regulator
MKETPMLLLLRLPARLDVTQTAEILGFLPYEISVLISAGLLKPLGRPARNGHKYLCADDISELSHDRAWLDKATRLLSNHWQARNKKAGTVPT